MKSQIISEGQVCTLSVLPKVMCDVMGRDGAILNFTIFFWP